MSKLKYPIWIHAVHQGGDKSLKTMVGDSKTASQWVYLLWKAPNSRYDFYVSQDGKRYIYRIDIVTTDGGKEVDMKFTKPIRDGIDEAPKASV